MVITNNNSNQRKSFNNLNKSTSSIGIPSIFFKNKSVLNFNQLATIPKKPNPKNSSFTVSTPHRSFLHEKIVSRLKKSSIIDSQSFHDDQKRQACQIIDSRKRKLSEEDTVSKSRKLISNTPNLREEIRSTNACASSFNASISSSPIVCSNKSTVNANCGKKLQLSPPKICVKLSKMIDKESILRDEQFLLNPYLFEEVDRSSSSLSIEPIAEQSKKIVENRSGDSRDSREDRPVVAGKHVTKKEVRRDEKIINLNANNIGGGGGNCPDRPIPLETYKTKSIKQLLTEIDNHRLAHGRANLSKSISQRFANIKSMLSNVGSSVDCGPTQSQTLSQSQSPLQSAANNSPSVTWSLPSQKKESDFNSTIPSASKPNESIASLTNPPIVSDPKLDNSASVSNTAAGFSFPTFDKKEKVDSKGVLSPLSFQASSSVSTSVTSVPSTATSPFQFPATIAPLSFPVSSSSSGVSLTPSQSTALPEKPAAPFAFNPTFNPPSSDTSKSEITKDSLQQSSGILTSKPIDNLFTPSTKTTEQSANLFTFKPLDKSATGFEQTFAPAKATVEQPSLLGQSKPVETTKPIDHLFDFNQTISSSKSIDQPLTFAPSNNTFNPTASVCKSTNGIFSVTQSITTSKPIETPLPFGQSNANETLKSSNSLFGPSITTSKPFDQTSNTSSNIQFNFPNSVSKPADQPRNSNLFPLSNNAFNPTASVSKSNDSLFHATQSITTSKPIETPLPFGQSNATSMPNETFKSTNSLFGPSITASKPFDQTSNTSSNIQFNFPNSVSKPADQPTNLFPLSNNAFNPTASVSKSNDLLFSAIQPITTSKPTEHLFTFNQSNSTFGQTSTTSKSTDQSPITFNQSIASTKPTNQPLSFGLSNNSFGQATVSSSNNMFGQPTVSSSNNMFGQPTVSSSNNMFGQPTVSSSNNMFGQPTVSSSNNMFGQPTVSSSNNMFGQPTVSSSNNMFGQPTVSSSNTMFGQPTVSSSNNMFGQPTVSSSNNMFGQSTAPSSNAFGLPTAPSSNAFQQSIVPSSSNTFGQSTASSSNAFGQSAVSSSNMFGQPIASSSNNMFGQSNGTFGQTNSTFGQSTNTFGQPNSTFSNSINASSQSNTVFGSSNNTFGQPSAASKPSDQSANMFNQSKSMPSFKTFGQSSSAPGLFGQNGVASSKPADTSVSLFGQSSQPATLFNTQSLSSSSTFAPSIQPSTFGQPAAVSKPESSMFGASTAPKPMFGASVTGNSFVFDQSKPSESSQFAQNGPINGSMAASTGSMFSQQSTTDTKPSLFGSNQLNSTNTTGSTNGSNPSSLFGSTTKSTGFVFEAAKSDNKPAFNATGSQNAFGGGSINKPQIAFSFNSTTAPVSNSMFNTSNSTPAFNFGQQAAQGPASGFNFGQDPSQSQTTNMFSAQSNPSYQRKFFKKRK